MRERRDEHERAVGGGAVVVGFEEIDATQAAVVGGKGAHLGELSRIDGIRVPAGFCVTTDAFRRVVRRRRRSMSGSMGCRGWTPTTGRRSARCPRRSAGRRSDRDARRRGGGDHRRAARLGEDVACAVRSSATAEDSPTASFAGQHDTYLNVVGAAAILEHVRRCWASLFTERAVTYRLRNGFDHRSVHMAVVVQRMVVRARRPASCSRPTR